MLSYHCFPYLDKPTSPILIKMLYAVAAIGACTYLYATDSIVAKVVVDTVKAVVCPTSDEKVAEQLKEKNTDTEDKDWVLY
uniref:Uncharacterized protein n=1 Tax=Caenorhabditis japonica TaxID=281687 RepID=A0A8R1DH54_CAEJA